MIGPSPMRLTYLIDGMEVAADIEEIELARGLLTQIIKQLKSLESDDTSSDDPNTALKAWWPSVAAAVRVLQAVATHLSVQTALEIIDEVSDPDLRVLLRVKLANMQLGVGDRSVVMVRKKRESWTRSSDK
jgi:hypothetical protein